MDKLKKLYKLCIYILPLLLLLFISIKPEEKPNPLDYNVTTLLSIVYILNLALIPYSFGYGTKKKQVNNEIEQKTNDDSRFKKVFLINLALFAINFISYVETNNLSVLSLILITYIFILLSNRIYKTEHIKYTVNENDSSN